MVDISGLGIGNVAVNYTCNREDFPIFHEVAGNTTFIVMCMMESNARIFSFLN
jgi:hypothetical protein